MGSDLIGSIASRAGVDHHIAGSAMAAMLPDVFHNLTENGQVPTGASIPDPSNLALFAIGVLGLIIGRQGSRTPPPD